MIVVDGQFYFKCSVDKKIDFIDHQNMVHFEIVESCGVILPYFKLVFLTNDESMVSTLHEGQVLNIQFGRNMDTFDDMRLSCGKIFCTRDGASRLEITVSGFLANNNFLSQTKKVITEKVSAVEAVKAVVSKHFKPKFNVETSEDKMNWVQYNTTDRNFVFDTILHAYKKDSFIASAITANGQFILKDIKKELTIKSRKFDWIIANADKAPNALKFSGDYQVQSQYSYMNSLGAYGHDMDWYEPENDVKGSNVYKPEILMALANKTSKKADVEKRYFGTQMQNKNVHDNFWKAYQQNLVGLLSLSTVKFAIPLAHTYAVIRPLDIVMFKDTSIADESRSNEYYSGVYVVSQVKRGISNMKCVMSVEICRESFNGVKNAN